MTASDVILKVRQRLMDESKEGWSDPELLDNLNMALSAVASDLMLWKRRWNTIASFGVDTYSIPEDFMAPISLFINDKAVEIKAIESALRSESDDPAAFIDFNSLILYPMPKVDDKIVLNYQAISRCEEIEDVVKIGYEHLDAVIFYTMSMSLQKDQSETALPKSKHYLALYKERIRAVSKITQSRRGANVTSRHQKV